MRRWLKVSVTAMAVVTVVSGVSGCSSTEGDASATYRVSQEIQDAYYKAICTGSAIKLGMGGTFDDATQTCTDPGGVKTTQTKGLAALLSSTPDGMRASIQFMVVQMDAPVADCPTADEFNTVVDLAITNTCVENAMLAMSAFMSS